MIDSVTFIGEIAEEQFKDWLNGVNAYYLNIKGNDARLHTTDCSHLGDAEGMNSTRNHKICSNNSEDLKIWAKSNKKNFKVCPDCDK